MFFSKSKKEDDSNRACCFCLYSSAIENNNFEYNCKFKGKVGRFSICRRFEFDITKKKPMGIDPNKLKELAKDLSDL